MRGNTRVTGGKGEEAAAEYLSKKGYKILAQNYRSKWGEVDLVAKVDETVVFVEVKTKTSDAYGEPWEMVNRWKVEQVKRMGEAWCREYGWRGRMRMDVVGVWLEPNSYKVSQVVQWENV